MRCVHSIHLICNISFKISFTHHIILFLEWPRINMVLKVKSGIQKTAGWQAFHQSSCSCSWFHSLTSTSRRPLLFNVTGNNFPLFRPRYFAQCGCMKVSQLKSNIQKLFRSNKLSSHLRTINACGTCIFTVARRSAPNSMLREKLKWNNKTQSKFMTSTAFHTKISLSMNSCTFSYKR